MNIQVAVLCDAATDDNGKLNLLGAFDTIYARELPAIHPQCAVALRVTFLGGDEGKRQLKLNFVDADGRAIMPPIDIPVEVALPEDMHFGTRNFIINIQQLKFEQPGLYSVDLSLDGQSQASIPLLVKHVPPGSEQSASPPITPRKDVNPTLR
jgi:hypothetical protein